MLSRFIGREFSALGKVVVSGVFAVGAVGGVAVAAASPGDDTPKVSEVVETTTTLPTTTTGPSPTTTAAPDDDAAKDATDGDETPAPTGDGEWKNFGQMVSEDARDGGVDGQEISRLAHEKNEARAAERAGDTDATDTEATDTEATDDDDAAASPADTSTQRQSRGKGAKSR